MLETQANTLLSTNYKNAWRLLPILFTGYIINNIDKANVGFAALEMNRDLGLSPAVFGLGAGIFFVTYMLFEIPSNLALIRFRPRIWLSILLIAWGFIASATAFISGQTSFYVLRLLLGAAEAGWWPGLLYFMCCWFPRSFRARAATWLFLASPCSAVIGFPLSGLLLSLPAYLGLASWQWLFIIEGAPAILVGLLAFVVLRSDPTEAEWLSPGERDDLVQTLAAEMPATTSGAKPGLHRAFFNRTVLFFCFMNLLFAINLYGIYFWIPSLVKGLGGLSYNQVGLVSAIPFVFGAIGMLLCAISSDRFGDRKWHIAVLLVISGLAMFCAALTGSPVVKMGWITLAVFGSFGQSGTLYAFATESFGRISSDPKMLATRIAAVIMAGSLGGFIAPYAIGLLLEWTKSFSYPLMIIGALLIAAGVSMAAARRALFRTNYAAALNT